MYNIAIQLHGSKGTVPVLLAQCIMYHVTGYKKKMSGISTLSPPCKIIHGCSATSANIHLTSHKAAVLYCWDAILFLVRIVQNVPLIVFWAG
jgi:hypothetical protein